MRLHRRLLAGILSIALALLCLACLDNSAPAPATSRYELIKTAKVLPETDQYPPILHSPEYAQPVPLDGLVNSAGLEDAPFITPDGKTLFLFFTPDAEKPAGDQVNDGVTGIYVAQKVSGEWGEAHRIQLGNGQALDGCPSFHGNTLWFCSIRAGNHRDIDIWTAELDGENWEEPENAGQSLNAILQVGELHLSADGGSIYYHRPGDSGTGYDLWTAEQTGQGWGNPQPVSPLNTELDDSRPALTPGGDELWFTRTYQGTPAIYRSVWSGTEWGEPELIISQFAGEPSLDALGNIYFTHHFFRDGKMIEADIYIAIKK